MAPSKTIPWRKNIFTLPFTGLLDQPFAQGATAAYSLRLLRAKHSGGLIRAHARDAGTSKGEADVLPRLQPDGSKIIELNSPIENLNTKAQNRLGAPAGGGDKVFADLVDAGGQNFDASSPKWYGQTPNKNDQSQATASNQIQIVNSGTVITESKSGKPALQFNNGQYIFSNNMSDACVEFFNVCKQNEGGTSNKQNVLFSDNYTGPSTYFVLASNKGSTNTNINNGVGSPTTEFLKSSSPSTRGDVYAALEDTLELVNTYNLSNLTQGFDFGLSGFTGTWFINGKQQEVLMYPSNRSSSDRSAIKTNIDNYYSIK